LNDLAFAGDGEPTSAGAFAECVGVVADARDAHGLSEVPLHLLTNATLLHRPAVRRGLEILEARGGVVWAKLDAGTEAYFRLVDGTTLPFRRVLANIVEAARRAPLVLQCMFLTLDGQGPSDAEIDAWVARISEILSAGGRIREVQVYSVARRPSDPRVGTLDVPRLEQIAARAAALGVPVRVYPGLG
jgi:wyosine [tRNA(Phe)-imidazoG37] synthetase (radical SAM superfamily)